MASTPSNKFMEENWHAFFELEKTKPVWDKEETMKALDRVQNEYAGDADRLVEQ